MEWHAYPEGLVRIAYLDESGRSRREPTIVVAGVIVHGDRDYRRLEGALLHLVGDTIPEQDRDGFIFHAGDLFGGGEYFKDKTLWPRERRYPIFRSLLSIISTFRLPVVFGNLVKAPYRAEVAPVLAHQSERIREEDTDIGEHMSAFAQAEIAIELKMREYPRDEICMVIAEDTDRIRRGVKDAHGLLRDPKRVASTEFATFTGLPLQRVIDTPHFAAKADSPLLQLADACAFLIMRRLRRDPTSQEFFEIIAPQVFVRPGAVFGERMGTERIGGGQHH